MSHELSHKSYRPLTVLSFRINYQLAHGDPYAMHVVNVALHAVTSVLLLLVGKRLFGAVSPAFMCGLLFAAHPIHTESVANIVSRGEILAGMFFALTMLAHTGGYGGLCLELACATAATLSKETGFAAFGICIVMDVLGFGGPWRSVGQWAQWVSARKARLMLITSTAAALLAHRAKLMGGTMVTFSWEDNPAGLSTRISLVNKALTQHYIAAYNAWLLIFPSDLCADRSRNRPMVPQRNFLITPLHMQVWAVDPDALPD